MTPRGWIRLDVMFLTRLTIERLGERHGPAGPLAIVALATEAQIAVGSGKRKDHDVVSWRYSDLARRIFTTKAKAKAIVHEAQTIGLLEMLDEARDGRFELRMLRFAEWHGKDPGAAARQRSSRASRGL